MTGKGEASHAMQLCFPKACGDTLDIATGLLSMNRHRIMYQRLNMVILQVRLKGNSVGAGNDVKVVYMRSSLLKAALVGGFWSSEIRGGKPPQQLAAICIFRKPLHSSG